MNEKEVFQLIYVSDLSKLNDVPEAFGQLIIVDDGNTRKIYYDGDNGRIQFTGIIITLETEAQRVAMQNPPQGFYFISETLILWNYGENGWKNITTPPDGQIVFDSLPQTGEADRVYLIGRTAYRYIDGRYQQIASTCVRAQEI